jgi:hypothetical protein
MLVGVPGSGKSTWVKNQDWAKDCVVISTDKYVEEWAESVGKTYSEVFQEYMPIAVARMADAVNGARDAGKDVIWDQTSTSISTRSKKFKMLPSAPSSRWRKTTSFLSIRRMFPKWEVTSTICSFTFCPSLKREFMYMCMISTCILNTLGTG